MRQVFRYLAGLALLLGCAKDNGLPTDQNAGNSVEKPSLAGAQIVRDNVAGVTTAPDSPLLVMWGFAEGVTLEDLCSGSPQPLSPNGIAQGVFPPPGGFLLTGHGQDLPVLVYEFADNPCDGVGESLVASGTTQVHASDKHLLNGTEVQNTEMRGTVDLTAGGQALFVVHSTFHVLADGAVKFDKTSITLTPI
jgi:hypothetical protein